MNLKMTFAHLTLATQDVLATSNFLQKTMGWNSLSMPGNVDVDADWLEIAPGQQIHILGIKDFKVSEFEEEYGRHFALFHPKNDLEALKQRIVENGSQVIPPIRETPFERFFFRDPNGYMFEIIDQDGYQSESE